VLWPRRLILVEHVPSGPLGQNPAAPLVRGRVTSLDKRPWKEIEPLQGPIEAEFLRLVYLGESIAPFRTLAPVLGVIPIEPSTSEVLNSEGASRRGFSHLARWLQNAESIWKIHSKQARSFSEQLDYFENLSRQFPLPSLRVVYAKSGTNPAAAILREEQAVVENRLYWLATDRLEEALFLVAILNSETARARAEKWQSMGQWGARDFDKVIFNLLIPRFDPKMKLHRDLAEAAERAEKVAAVVPLEEGEHFTRARKRIRDALRADGVTDEIDKLVECLLETRPQQIAA
jgi:hypothetical protein